MQLSGVHRLAAVVLTTVTAAVSAAACKGSSSAIANATGQGQAASNVPSTSVVLLTLRDQSKGSVGYCSGVFIRDDLVLTTAHCFTTHAFTSIALSASEGPLHNKSPVASTYIINPKFDPSLAWTAKLGADVGLAQFAAQTASPDSLVKMAAGLPAVGAVVTMAGYAESTPGDATTGGVYYSLETTLQSLQASAGNALVTAPVAIASPGVSTYGTAAIAPAGIIGDSGGPLFAPDGSLVGLSEGPASAPQTAAAQPAPAGSAAKVFYFVNLREAAAASYIAEQMSLPHGAAPTAGPQGAGPAAPTPGNPNGAAQTPTGVYKDPTSGQTFPYCTSASSADARYPGWGYEQGQSCHLQN